MSTKGNDIQLKSINTLRFLAVDAVQKANSGHPGMPMACSPIAYMLYRHIMRHNPVNPEWVNRDRFVLSAGHGSMLLYGILHLSGYNVSLDDLKNFRQLHSITPGHPEYGKTGGVETTTGPLGQGFTNAVGMALAKEFLAAKFNKKDFDIIDHYIYAIVSDGDLMEGVTHEAASFAGHNKLRSIIFFYDANEITIDGDLSLAMSEDVGKRFEGYGWHVQYIEDVNNTADITDKVKAAKESDKPSIIITKTRIGFGSPNKEGTAGVHGAPLGEDEVKLTKEKLGWETDKHFYIPEEVKDHFASLKAEGEKAEKEWNILLEGYEELYPEEGKLFRDVFNEKFDLDWDKIVDELTPGWGEKMASRKASGAVINKIAEQLPTFIGGSADLAPSNNTQIKQSEDFSTSNYGGRNLHFGIREHAMGGILNGMNLYKGVIAYGGTFLVFSDYMRPTIRLAALSGLRPIFVFTHDSIGLGEDGPTHQPVEHLSSLRAIPGSVVIRPADANETIYAWKAALEYKGGPVSMALTRQNLKTLDRSKFASAEGVLKGAYILKDAEGKPDVIIMATGSEVGISVEAAEKLEAEGIKARVVSFASMELFEAQDKEYREKVLPADVTARLSVEAGVAQGWEKYTGFKGASVSIETFGVSAPANEAFAEFGFTPDNIAKKAKELL